MELEQWMEHEYIFVSPLATNNSVIDAERAHSSGDAVLSQLGKGVLGAEFVTDCSGQLCSVELPTRNR